MPTYEYRCDHCGNIFEVVQRIIEPPLKKCDHCGGSIYRAIFPVGIIFKGPGFHINDYGRGNGNGRKPSGDRERKKPETSEKAGTAAASGSKSED